MRSLLLVLCLLVPVAVAAPAGAVQPDEILDDPALEARARALTVQMRCVVCRNESVDESNADIARDVRIAVRERLVAGDSDEQVIQFMVDRYGEFILLKPTATGSNLILWLSAPVLLILGLGFAALAVRRRAPAAQALSAQEEARLKELLGQGEKPE